MWCRRDSLHCVALLGHRRHDRGGPTRSQPLGTTRLSTLHHGRSRRGGIFVNARGRVHRAASSLWDWISRVSPRHGGRVERHFTRVGRSRVPLPVRAQHRGHELAGPRRDALSHHRRVRHGPGRLQRLSGRSKTPPLRDGSQLLLAHPFIQEYLTEGQHTYANPAKDIDPHRALCRFIAAYHVKTR